jgi:hypothetical protein
MEKDQGVRLIWDFRGRDSLPIAEHHAVHLAEFLSKEGLEGRTGSEQLSEAHHMAFMDIQMDKMLNVRDALRPHRAIKIEME